MVTMQRSPATRVLAAVIAPWFAIVMAEPAALHQCAMHSGHAVHAAAGTMAHQHGMDARADAVPGRAPSRDEAARYCTCLGGCCAAAPVAVPVTSELSWIPSSIRSESRAEAAEQVLPAAAGHLLPFANGPPAARA